MKILKALNISIILFIALLQNSCTKTKVGDYTLTIDGTEYIIQRKAYCCDTTGTYTIEPYHYENKVKVTNVNNSTIEIDGAIWKKDGKKISMESSYDSNNSASHALGGGNRSTDGYQGTILSNTLISGDYHLEGFSYASNSFTWSYKITATFTIRKN
jgi:hypothetical protein